MTRSSKYFTFLGSFMPGWLGPKACKSWNLRLNSRKFSEPEVWNATCCI